MRITNPRIKIYADIHKKLMCFYMLLMKNDLNSKLIGNIYFSKESEIETKLYRTITLMVTIISEEVVIPHSKGNAPLTFNIKSL